MKNKMRFLTLAALAVVAVMMTGCTKENGGSMTLTTTVKIADDGAKALTAGGVKTFAAGERIAVVYKNTSGTTVKAVSNALTADDISNGGKVANFTVDLTDPDREQSITYIYPAAMANNDGTVNNAALNNQDGTLAALSSSLDLGTYTGLWNSTVTLTNGIAIGQFTIQNTSGNDITSTITGFTVTNGTNTYTVTRSAAAGPIYVAMLPVTTGDIEFTATDGTNNYESYVKTVTGKTLAAGHFYPITVRMDKQINLARLNEDYVAQNGDILTGTLAGDYKISVNAAGATVTLRNATITGTNSESYSWAGITCENNTTLVIKGINNVTGFYEDYPGIQIASGNTLTIQGTGTLNASSNGGANGWGAGIGGSDLVDCGNIVINSGTIYATGGKYMAGIGGGYQKSCGSITINGGDVTATGGELGAGIGGGGYSANCGSITINDGDVTATGGEMGAGIGGGTYGSCGSITINGGTVTATGGNKAAGIGTGRVKANNTITGGDINISGGTVVATGGIGGAGIGIGYAGGADGAFTGGDINITGGTVEASGGIGAAGIGSGFVFYTYTTSSTCGNISITGGQVTATGGDGGENTSNSFGVGSSFSEPFYGGAGIGTGSSIYTNYEGASNCGTITIGNGVTRVTATKGGGTRPASNSIGKTVGYHSRSTCGTVTIGGTVYWNGSAYQNGGDTYLTQSSLVYPQQ